jgi:hypothetical protein
MSNRRLNTIRRLAEAIDNLHQRENQIIEFEESPTNIKYIISDDGKKLLKCKEYKKGEYSQDICPILNQPFNENQQIIELPCKHIFDEKSILFWLENQKSECPVCRFKLPCKELSYFYNNETESDEILQEEKDDEIDLFNRPNLQEEKDDRENINTETTIEALSFSNSTQIAINLSYDNDIEILRNAFNLSVSQLNDSNIN